MSDPKEVSVTIERSESSLDRIAKHLPDAPMPPTTGIAAIALDMALKYHDIAIVKDGAMYQQYKLEGRNMHDIQLDMVFETALRIEEHLIKSEKRIANILFAMIEESAEGVETSDESDEVTNNPDLRNQT